MLPFRNRMYRATASTVLKIKLNNTPLSFVKSAGSLGAKIVSNLSNLETPLYPLNLCTLHNTYLAFALNRYIEYSTLVYVLFV